MGRFNIFVAAAVVIMLSASIAVASGDIISQWMPRPLGVFLVTVLSVGYWLGATFAVGTLLAAAMFRCAVRKISVGVSPAIWVLRRPSVELRVGSIPLTSYVTWRDPSIENPLLEGTDGEGGDRPFRLLPTWQRSLIAVAGPAATIAAGVVLTNDLHLANVLTAWRNLFSVLISSEPRLLVWIVGSFDQRGAIVTVTEAAARLAALNLLPIPVLSGGALVFYLIEAMIGRPLPPAVRGVVYRIGFVALFSAFAVVLWRIGSELASLY